MFKKVGFLFLVLALTQTAIIQTNVAPGGIDILPSTIEPVPNIPPPIDQ
jgi:hypothetical protein